MRPDRSAALHTFFNPEPMPTFLNTPEDLAWLTEAHKVPTEGMNNAVLYGNEDCPERVETRTDDHYQCRPVVYLRNEDGDLVRQ